MYLNENSALERHYRIAELSRMWGLKRKTVRKLVKDDSGVIKINGAKEGPHDLQRAGIRCEPHTHPADKQFMSS